MLQTCSLADVTPPCQSQSAFVRLRFSLSLRVADSCTDSPLSRSLIFKTSTSYGQAACSLSSHLVPVQRPCSKTDLFLPFSPLRQAQDSRLARLIIQSKDQDLPYLIPFLVFSLTLPTTSIRLNIIRETRGKRDGTSGLITWLLFPTTSYTTTSPKRPVLRACLLNLPVQSSSSDQQEVQVKE